MADNYPENAALRAERAGQPVGFENHAVEGTTENGTPQDGTIILETVAQDGTVTVPGHVTDQSVHPEGDGTGDGHSPVQADFGSTAAAEPEGSAGTPEGGQAGSGQLGSGNEGSATAGTEAATGDREAAVRAKAEKMTKAQLKVELDKRGVDYDSDDDKPELVSAVVSAVLADGQN